MTGQAAVACARTVWQDEINGVLEFYIDTIEHPASEPEPPKPNGPLRIA